MPNEIFPIILAIIAIVVLLKIAKIVPQKQAYVIERLGKYTRTLEAGFHLLIPFLDRVAYKHTLKEQALEVPQQTCITKDNISVGVDGVIYLQVVDPKLASYGIDDYAYAGTQLAQTTLRSVIGKLELDKTFEEREFINGQVVSTLDKAAEPWGLKVLRYEISDIIPPKTVQDALEKQMRAERERRAVVAESEGEKEATINVSIADRERQINEATGKAEEIRLLAEATSKGIYTIAQAISAEGGKEAVNLRIAEQYVNEFGKLAKTNNTMILPAELANIGSAVAAVQKVLDTTKNNAETQTTDEQRQQQARQDRNDGSLDDNASSMFPFGDR